MKRFRVYVVLAVVCVVLLAGGPALTVFGQDTGPKVNCNGLSEADCQLMTDATVMMRSLTSFSVPAWSVDAHFDEGPQSMRLLGSGQGAAVLPESFLALAAEMQGLDMTNLEPLIDFYGQLNSEMLMQALSEMGLYLVIDNLELEVPGQSSSVSADILYLDQGFYVRLESPTGEDAWFGDTVDVNADELAELDAAIAEALAGLESEELRQTWAQLSEFSALSQQFTDLVNRHVVTTRGADIDRLGQNLAVFTTSYDIKALIADPELPALLIEFINHPGLAEMGADPEEFENINESQIQFMLMTLNILLKEATFSAEQWIGTEDQYIHQLAWNASLNVDLSLLGGEVDVQTLSASLSGTVELADFNEDVMADVEVPADYRPLEDTGSFLVGSASMVEQELALGQSFAAGFSADGDEQDIYSLALDAGQSVVIELVSDDFPYLNLYGPDGFLIGEFDTYDTDALEFTATEAGTYLVEVKAYWAMDYEITIRAK